MLMQSMKHLELPKELPEGCGLEYILSRQYAINEKIYPVLAQHLNMPPDPRLIDKEKVTKEMLLALMRECAEALDLINSKPWKQKSIIVDEMELKFEFIDILHFCLSLFTTWEMSRDEVLGYYISKNIENFERQERNY